MLTIEEIKKELDAGKKVIAELEDPNGLRERGTHEPFIQEWLNNDVSIRAYNCKYFITSSGVGIPHDNLISYFRIKRNALTFDDLIDAVVQAQKDGLLFSVNLIPAGLEYQLRSDTFNVSIFEDVANNIQREIDFINSLYTETFVIESEQDCKRIKQDAKITFLNGNSVVMDNPPTDDGIVRIWNDGRYDFTVLQGATVTQKRGAV